MVYTCPGILSRGEKEGNFPVCDNLDGPWGHYAKWNTSDVERWTSHNITYI